jgi:hypothetical protein
MFLPPLDWHILLCVNHNLNCNVDLLLFAQPGMLYAFSIESSEKCTPATTAVLHHLVVEVSCRDGGGRIPSKGLVLRSRNDEVRRHSFSPIREHLRHGSLSLPFGTASFHQMGDAITAQRSHELAA